MRIIISPAKKMNADPDALPFRDLPAFLPQTQILLDKLNSMSDAELQALWKCNDQIAALNIARLRAMNLRSGLTPAILAYEGIQYQYMSPGVFTDAEFAYIQRHLRILSGFYGVLRPFDGVVPYRLEMQARLPTDGHKDLYGFWGASLAEKIVKDAACIINLASREYSLAVSKHLPKSLPFITCAFAEEKNGKLVEKATMCKMARGEMVRFMAENSITDPEALKTFNRLDFTFSPDRSTPNTLTFLRKPSKPTPDF